MVAHTPEAGQTFGMGHERNDARSLAYHRVIAARLPGDPSLLQAARAKLRRWRAEGSVHDHYILRWEQLLALPMPQLMSALVDSAQEVCDLRQVSPFTAALDPRERWTIWRNTQAGVQQP